MYVFLLSQMSDSYLYIMPLSNCEFPENWCKKSLICLRLSIKFFTFALFCPIWVKFSSGKVYKNLLCDWVLWKSVQWKSYEGMNLSTLLSDLDEFGVRLWYCWTFIVFVKICKGMAILFFMHKNKFTLTCVAWYHTAFGKYRMPW
jgi:hypothetical protein